MPGRTMLCLGVTMLLLVPSPARAQHGHAQRVASHHPHPRGNALGAAGGYPVFAVPYFVGVPGGVYPSFPVIVGIGPAGLVPPMGPMLPPPMPLRGPLLPAPPRHLVGRQPEGNVRPASIPKADPARARQLMTLGDRLFRGGYLKKAEERYQQAARVDPGQAAPYLHLAQIALARGNYTAAANRLREAETAQPGWILTAPDIQAIYGEPAEFGRQIARLESYVQTHPDDRDAWLLLGAQWFLTGRTARAVDVFQRINDPNRKPDIALAAFLDASNQAKPKAGERRDPLE